MRVKRVSLADANAHLSRLVEEAAAAEPVCITRRGKAVAQITAVGAPRKRIDAAALRAMTDAMAMQPESARDFIRRLRDEDRYDALPGHLAARASLDQRGGNRADAALVRTPTGGQSRN